jgi:transcriptional regulator with XRE-family HTH domain
MRETFSQRLTRICKERELNQIKLAALVHASQPAIRRWLRGDFHPQYWELTELAVKLDLSLDYLCCLTDEPRTLGYKNEVTEPLPNLQKRADIPVGDAWRADLYRSED